MMKGEESSRSTGTNNADGIVGSFTTAQNVPVQDDDKNWFSVSSSFCAMLFLLLSSLDETSVSDRGSHRHYDYKEILGSRFALPRMTGEETLTRE